MDTKKTRPCFTRLTLIADISPVDTYSGLTIRHTDITLGITVPVVLSSWDIKVVRDNTMVVQMDLCEVELDFAVSNPEVARTATSTRRYLHPSVWV